jgi:hypothetical protein
MITNVAPLHQQLRIELPQREKYSKRQLPPEIQTCIFTEHLTFQHVRKSRVPASSNAQAGSLAPPGFCSFLNLG